MYKVGLDRNRIVMPGEMLRQFIAEMHLIYGHIGGRKTYQMISEPFYAPQMRKLVNKILKTCDTCQKTKHLTRRYDEYVQPILTNAPNELLSIDFDGPLPTSTGGVKHLLTTIDAFSKFIVVYLIKKANTTTVIRKIFGEYIPKYGRPKGILSDHGTQLTSPKWIRSL